MGFAMYFYRWCELVLQPVRLDKLSSRSRKSTPAARHPKQESPDRLVTARGER